MVALVGPNAPEWAEWAWGAWLAGAALVPLPSPVRVRDKQEFQLQVASLTRAVGCTLVVGQARYLELIASGTPRLDWDEPPAEPGRAELDEPLPSSTALILCTSGSTATPKGIVVDHAKAVGRMVTTSSAFETELGVTVSWLPFYHIGGLSGVIAAAGTASQRHILPVERFVRDPAEWLRLVSGVRARLTAAPASAWSAAVRALANRPEGVDLSCLGSAIFGMEMVDPDVVEEVLEICRPLGLSEAAIVSSYGSSEAGYVTGTRPGGGARVDAIDLEELARSGRVVAPRPGSPTKRVVSCGPPALGVSVLIGDPQEPWPERQVGEIFVRGELMSDGYVNAGSEGLFVEGWMRTGDLGYFDRGELFVTGRSKEVIVHLGRKYHPEDIEQAVARALGDLGGRAVAFAPLRGREGELVVVVEVAATGSAEATSRARAAVIGSVGLVPSEVIAVPVGTVPLASNGKLQRTKAREMHGAGQLGGQAAEAAALT